MIHGPCGVWTPLLKLLKNKSKQKIEELKQNNTFKIEPDYLKEEEQTNKIAYLIAKKIRWN